MNTLFSILLIVSILPLIFARLINARNVQPYERIIVLFLFVVICSFSLFPLKTAQPIASFFGIGRGSDLIFYIFIVFSLLFFDFLYRKQKVLERRQIKLMQSIAIFASITDE